MEYSPLFVTLMGLCTVFFGLVCIIFLTTAMGSLFKTNAKPAPAVAAAPVAAAPAAPVVNTTKQQEVIAAITAALTEELGPNARNVKILDIKKI